MKAVHLVELVKTVEGNFLPRSGHSLCGEYTPSMVTTQLHETTCKRCLRSSIAEIVSAQNMQCPMGDQFGPTLWSQVDWNKK